MIEDYDLLLGRQSGLLTDIANVINGPEPELVMWSHSDLPGKVAALKAETERLQAEAGATQNRTGVNSVAAGPGALCKCDGCRLAESSYRGGRSASYTDTDEHGSVCDSCQLAWLRARLVALQGEWRVLARESARRSIADTGPSGRARTFREHAAALDVVLSAGGPVAMVGETVGSPSRVNPGASSASR